MRTQTKKSECRRIVQEYIKKYNPYERTPALGYNIAEMSRYATRNNCTVSDLSKEEVERFAVR